MRSGLSKIARSVTLTVCLIAASVFGASQAAAAERGSPPEGRYCATLIGKAPSSHENSPVFDRHCSNT